LWRKASKLGLRRKKNINTTKDLILNLKVLAFTNIEDVDKRFEAIKIHFNKLGGDYEEFLAYFQINWISGKKHMKDLWNYSLAVNNSLI
jgi:hypothetical protein